MFLVPTRLLQPGRRPLSPGSRAGLGAALVLLAIVSAVEAADGRFAHYVALLSAVPLLAAAVASWPVVLGVGVVATLTGAGFALTEPKMSMITPVSVVAVAVVTGLAVAVASVRQRQAEQIVELTKLASVAQQAVLRPLGPQVGTLSVAGRYISSTATAEIGGDLYEAIDTPYGVRMIIGDVRGKGLDAVRLASIVLGSYRHV
ncbi:serine/threonine-protein phosphatase, partial [Micromonospora sp. NPDC005215]